MRRRPSFHLAAVLFAGAVVAVSACAQGGTAQTWTYPPAAAGASAPAPAASAPAASHDAASSASPDAVGGEALAIEAFDLGFTPAMLEVPSAGRYEVRLINTGAAPHDITFPTGETGTAAARRDRVAGGRHPGRGHDLPVLDPRACDGRDDR